MLFIVLMALVYGTKVPENSNFRPSPNLHQLPLGYYQPQRTTINIHKSRNNDALGYRDFDLSNGNNKDFVGIVNWQNNPSFTEFLNSDKEIPTLVKQVLNSYGIPTTEVLGEDRIFHFPDANVLAEKLEHDVTLYISVKNYVRRNLHKIEEYLSENAVLITAYVGSLRRDRDELKIVYAELYGPNKRTMSMAWQLGLQEYINLAKIGEADIKRFRYARDWRSNVKVIVSRTF